MLLVLILDLLLCLYFCQLRASLLYNRGMSLHRSGRYWSINHLFTIPKLFHALICIELLQEKLLMGRNTIRFYLI